jgi:hypothetical protein
MSGEATSPRVGTEDGWALRFAKSKSHAWLLVLSCFAGLGLVLWHLWQPDPFIRTLELSGWSRDDAPSALLREWIRQAATDWRPYPGLILLAAGGLLGRVVFAGPLARRLSNAAGWVLVLLAFVHGLEYRLLDLLAGQQDPPLRTYGFWLQASAFLGYALMPVAAVIAVLGALTAVTRLTVDKFEKKPEKSNPLSGVGDLEGDVESQVDGHFDGHTIGGDTAHWRRGSSVPAGREEGDLGICLSGGGIRSATFAMGALQALQGKPALGGAAATCELTRARYLTAVSGGAYTAGALVLAVQPEREAGKAPGSPSDGPRGPQEATLGYESVFRPGSDEFDHLRRHSSYIADGMRQWSTAVLVLLRGALLSTLLLALVALVAGRWTGHLYYAFGRQDDLRSPWQAVWGVVFAVVGVLVLAILLWLLADWLGLGNHPTARRGIAEAAWVAWMAFAVLVLLSVVVPLVTWGSLHIIENSGGKGASGVVGGAFKGGVLGLLGVITTILGLLNRQRADVLNSMREGKGALEKLLGDTGSRIVRWLPVLVGLGLVTAVYLMVFGTATFYAATGEPGHNPMVSWGSPVWQSPLSNLWLTAAITLALIIFYVSADETAMGLHPFYRRRLASAFAVRRVWRPPEGDKPGGFEAKPYAYDETTRIEDYCRPESGGTLMQPQIIFCAAAHCSDPDQTPPGRKVLPFSFSSDALGGPEVKWCPPARMRQGAGGKGLGRCLDADLTVEAAMAVSGAAFASASGSGRVPANMIMALINARLGTWIANPAFFGDGRPDWWRARPPRIRRLSYLLREIFGIHPLDFPMLFVTDGAHYESLGLVELLRHRCTEIYCFDSSCDSDTFASSIARAMTLAYDELGVTIHLEDPDQADPHRSGANDDTELKHRIAERPIIAGTVTYPELPGVEAQKGVLVIGRSTLYDGMPWEIRRHAAAHPMFPQDATGDQWFDDGKFNAYTNLGRRVGTLAFDEMKRKLQEGPLDFRLPPGLDPRDRSTDRRPVGAAGDGRRGRRRP